MDGAMKYVSLNDRSYRYLTTIRSGAEDPLLERLRRETASLGDESRMQISVEQGAFFTILLRAIRAQHALEIGTFTGYSSICIARGLPDDGKLVCLDSSDEWTRIARKYWAEAGLANRIELRLGEAVPTLQSFP